MQRKPIATEAMYLMMKNAFDLGYRRLEWKCNALNAPSIKAAERLGLSFEGVFRQATIVKGHSRDTAWFSILDTEWPQVRSAIETWLAADNFDEAGNQKLRLSDLTSPLLQDSWPQISVKLDRQIRFGHVPVYGLCAVSSLLQGLLSQGALPGAFWQAWELVEPDACCFYDLPPKTLGSSNPVIKS
jgi:hypothetical protein